MEYMNDKTHNVLLFSHRSYAYSLCRSVFLLFLHKSILEEVCMLGNNKLILCFGNKVKWTDELFSQWSSYFEMQWFLLSISLFCQIVLLIIEFLVLNLILSDLVTLSFISHLNFKFMLFHTSKTSSCASK